MLRSYSYIMGWLRCIHRINVWKMAFVYVGLGTRLLMQHTMHVLSRTDGMTDHNSTLTAHKEISSNRVYPALEK